MTPDDEDVFDGYGLEISLGESEDFLKIRETLTRMGIASKKDKTLRQSCHILHVSGRYAVMHFKELYALDGKESDITEEDLGRRNTIAILLKDWGLCKIVDELCKEDPRVPPEQIAIIKHSAKSEWNLMPMYRMQRRKKKNAGVGSRKAKS